MRRESVDVAIAPVISQVFPLLGQVIIWVTRSTHSGKNFESRVPLCQPATDIEALELRLKPIRFAESLKEFCTLLTNLELPRYPLKIKKEAFHF